MALTPFFALFNAGRFAELEARLDKQLRRQPGNGTLWSLLGATRQMLGKNGIDALRKATLLLPGDADLQTNLGTALHHAGQLAQARTCYERAIALRPTHLRARLNLANLLADGGYLTDAEACFREALRADPRQPEVLLGLGNLLTQLDRSTEAAPLLRAALAVAPDFAEAHFCLGNLLREQGAFNEAEAAYRAALRLRPDFAPAGNNLGNLLLERGFSAEAIACFRNLAQQVPDNPEVHRNLGVAFVESGQFAEAEACYRQAIALAPENADGYGRLAYVLQETGRLEEAAAAYEKQSALDPESTDARMARAFLALPVAPRDGREADSAAAHFTQAIDDIARWAGTDPGRRARLAQTLLRRQPFLLAYRTGNLCAALSRFGDLAVACCPHTPCPTPPPAEKIRLLIVSHQVHRHSVWDIVLSGLLAHIDRCRFELLLYHTGEQEDEETAAARQRVDFWRDRRDHPDFCSLREAIRADRPHVIFYPEIGMDPFSFHLATHRLAPLQVASWGHPVTTGLPTIDLFFSGELLDTEQACTHYRERLIRLPGTGCCTRPLAIPAAPVPDLADRLRDRAGPRFLIAQRAFKFDPGFDSLYARIAAKTGPCVFLIPRDPLYPWASDRVMARLEAAFRSEGLDPARFLLEIPWQSDGAFVSLLDTADVFLDCPAFSGYTTAWQALHRGLPVVTHEGEFLRQRLAAALLRRISAPELIARTLPDYVRIACELAGESQNPTCRATRRAALMASAPAADGDLSVVRAFEQTLISELAARQKP